MREIKFKAWDIKNGKMVAGKYFTISTFDTGRAAIILISDEFLKPHSDDEYKLIQYTGLKDENDKEIYEGDIVKYIDDSDTEQIGVIIFSDIIFAYIAEAINGDEEGNNDIQLYKYDSIEVIGNKFENPELLEEK